jgi:Putative transposase of IS4/5 family (DUF4096)
MLLRCEILEPSMSQLGQSLLSHRRQKPAVVCCCSKSGSEIRLYKPRGVPSVNDRRVLNGIFWVLRSGAPWRDLPESFVPYTTCYNRFIRWRWAGNVLRQACGELPRLHPPCINPAVAAR